MSGQMTANVCVVSESGAGWFVIWDVRPAVDGKDRGDKEGKKK